MTRINFQSVGQINIPANGDFQSDAVRVNLNHVFVVVPQSSGIVGGPPTYSIEVSDDGTNWQVLTGASALAIGVSFDGDKFPWSHVRINYLANATSAGTVSFAISLKRV